MRLDFSDERVLAVVAHPDDAELLCAGTLARARDDGAAIAICVLCNGDKGQPAKPVKDLKKTRRNEMRAAAKLLTAELFFGDFSDGTLAVNESSRKKLITIFRKFRPTLVLAHSANDYHSDHRAASQLAEAVSWFSASTGHRTPAKPLKSPPALWWMDTVNATDFEPGFFVDVSDYVELKQQMLDCHRSQMARANDSDFTPIQELMQRQLEFRGSQARVAAAEAFQCHTAFQRATAW